MATERPGMPRGGIWRLTEARSRFSEVVRRAGSEGPQRVTVRGRPAAVVVTADEYERLAGSPRSAADLFADMRGCGLADIVPERDKDTGRDFEFPE